MRLKTLSLLFILGLTTFCHAQNFIYDYQMICLDSTWDESIDPKLQQYVDKQKAKMGVELDEVIGQCEEALYAYTPASPLSNLLTDMLLKQTPLYTSEEELSGDLAILNFGGIRTHLPAGDVTVGDIFNLSPFNNTIVVLDIRGSELRKALMRFSERNATAAFAGGQITFLSGTPYKILIQGEPLEEERIYKVITLDFIAGGGDKILNDIEYLSTLNTGVLYRDFLIQEIRKITQTGQSIRGYKDDRVIILSQP